MAWKAWFMIFEIQSAILQAISEHTANIPQSDDITLVVIKRKPG